jgi:hypothetical protein
MGAGREPKPGPSAIQDVGGLDTDWLVLVVLHSWLWQIVWLDLIVFLS